MIHCDDTVGDIARKVQLVGDDDHRHSCVGQSSHKRQHLVHHLRVERGCRLVEEDQVGLHREGPGDRDPLFLPAG